VNGLKALVNKDPLLLARLCAQENADLLLLQETKLQECFVLEYESLIPGFVGFWSCSKTKKGYAGTATFVKACYVEGTPWAGAANTEGGGGSKNGGGGKQQSLKAFFGKKEEEGKSGGGGGGGGNEKEEEKKAGAAAATAGAKVLGVTVGIDGDGSDEEGRCVSV
jgi:exonuclease III